MYVELGMNCKRFAFSLYFLVFFLIPMFCQSGLFSLANLCFISYDFLTPMQISVDVTGF